MTYDLAKKVLEMQAWDALADAIESEDKERSQRALLFLRNILSRPVDIKESYRDN